MEEALNTTAATMNDHLDQDVSTMSWIMAKLEQSPIKLSLIFECAMVLGSVVPYIPQYFTIKQSQNTEGFSLYVCLTLLIANVLRIMFWFGKHFETALLVQSIVMILAMFILLELCVRVRNSNLIIQQKKRFFLESQAPNLENVLSNNKKNSTCQANDFKRSRSLNEINHNEEVNNNNNDKDDCSNCLNNNTMKTSCSETFSSKKQFTTIDMNQQKQEKNTENIPNQQHRQQQQNQKSCEVTANLPLLTTPKQTIVSTDLDGIKPTVDVLQEDDQNGLSSQQTKIINQIGDEAINTQEELNLETKKKSKCNKKEPESENAFKRRRFIEFDFRYFWEWTDFMSYLECMAIFTLMAGTVLYFLIDVPLVVEGYGLVALVTESLLASPQFFRNLKVKSTEGMSKLMVFTWFLGDLYKTVYFFVRKAPFQFLICGCIQLTFDTLIFLQIIFYKKSAYHKISKSRLKHLENRARKRFKSNTKSKKMLHLLTTASTETDCPNSIVTTSVHHPQPISKINQTETSKPISIQNHLQNTDLIECVGPENLDLIELDGYDNPRPVLDGSFEDIDIEAEDDDKNDVLKS